MFIALVSGGAICKDAATWHPARRKFLLPITAVRSNANEHQRSI
jgi:hypothetical protein